MKTYLGILAALGFFAAAPALAAEVYSGVHTSLVYADGGFGQHALIPPEPMASLPGVPNTGVPTAATGPIYTGVHTNITYAPGGYGAHAIIPSE